MNWTFGLRIEQSRRVHIRPIRPVVYVVGGIRNVLQKLQRPLNEQERRCLSRPLDTVRRIVTLSGTLRWFALWAGILVICILLFAKGLYRPSGPSGLWMVVMP